MDAANSAPARDWKLVSLLAVMLNTNDLRHQLSVNDPDPGAWAVQFDGVVALTNLGFLVVSNTVEPQFSPTIISANSQEVSLIANAIQTTKAGLPNATFHGIGDILATPQLTLQSPFIQLTNLLQQRYGINDQAYEAIPSQLLPRLRADSIGKLVSTNGQFRAQFSGYDGHAYVVQISQDLLHWTSISTNSPANGVFDTAVPATGFSGSEFFRTVLFQ